MTARLCERAGCPNLVYKAEYSPFLRSRHYLCSSCQIAVQVAGQKMQEEGKTDYATICQLQFEVLSRPCTNHLWEDQSYHGTPDYECAFCNVSKKSPAAEAPCPKGAEGRMELRRQIEFEERLEYQRLVDAEERAEYLRQKYEH